MYRRDFAQSEIHCTFLSAASSSRVAETVLITARVSELSAFAVSPPRLLLLSIPFAFDILCAIRADGWDSYGRNVLRVSREEIRTRAWRFDQRKAVMPFRVDKWQSPTQPSRTDFACSRCSLIRGSNVRHCVLWSLWATQPVSAGTLCACLLYKHFTIKLELKGWLLFNCFWHSARNLVEGKCHVCLLINLLYRRYPQFYHFRMFEQLKYVNSAWPFFHKDGAIFFTVWMPVIFGYFVIYFYFTG